MSTSAEASKQTNVQLQRERASAVASVAADFARLAAKQKKLSAANSEACRKLRDEMLRFERSTASASASADEYLDVLSELERQIGALFETLYLREKELNAAISKYVKGVENCFGPDAHHVCRGLPLDKDLLERAVGEHLFREGHFDIADSFAKESSQRFDDRLRLPFKEMHCILHLIRKGELEPAIRWAQKNYASIHSDATDQESISDIQSSMKEDDLSRSTGNSGTCLPMASVRSSLANQLRELEFKLHRLQFIAYLQQRRLSEALAYARQHLSRFQRSQSKEIQQLMACFAFASRISQSPYASLFTSALCDDVMQSFRRCFWALLNLSDESPLYSVVACGTIALPHLIRATRLLAARESWSQRDELPVEIDLGKKYKYHSIFVCPVSREQSTESNPPYLLPCGHVLCKETVNRLPRGNARFKCPYCPSEQQVAACRQIHF